MEMNSNQVAVASAIRDLIPTYLANRKKEVLELRAALANQDLERVRYFAHRMRGGGAAFGFPDITVLGRQIESAAQGGHAGQIGPLIDEYDVYLNSLSITVIAN